MKKYLEQVKKRVDDLQAKIVQIPREDNKQADHLAEAASVEHMIITVSNLFSVAFSILDDLLVPSQFACN